VFIAGKKPVEGTTHGSSLEEPKLRPYSLTITVWNALPRNVRLSGSASAHTFKKKLKTALFSAAYL